MSLTPPDAARWLLEKYRGLDALRRETDEPSRETLLAVSHRWPGSLRELDALSPEALSARIDALEAALDAPAPWMLWMAAWHHTMALALATKRLLSGRKVVTAEEAQSLFAAACTEVAWVLPTLDVRWVSAVASPPRGRLGLLVAAVLGAHFDTDPIALWQAVFPTHRADRFTRVASPSHAE